MNLCYRGVSYESEPLSLEVSESNIIGTYRGQQYHRCYPRHVPKLKPKPRLQYRGLVYQTCPLIQTETSLNAQLAAIAKTCEQKPRSQEKNKFNLADIHQSNLRHNLNYRLQVAREKGDTRLVQLLEKESQELMV
ncbi:DUF4278 domain-containing protein [Spirulina sp. 06S082]|uniref:DUF4278 domain-containing protein n=1 Tax=Spirulina sp. 06S082 TaxID=3110248 RepID=UPI002B20D4A2|nr:DUF4278 domain-containing protein [Spirulina sp. 06S082]MEA5470627.1 DUF4278 domain-containing protein [Spirulina sp. 06S082]